MNVGKKIKLCSLLDKGGIKLFNKIDYIENSCYPDDDSDSYIDWEEKIRQHFFPNHVDDVSDFDRVTTCTYLVSLNKNNEGLSSDALNILLKSEDAYFLEISISAEKPLINALFYKYPKGRGGQVLETSEELFLIEHQIIYDKYISFAKNNNLIVLTGNDLKEKVFLDGRPVSVYYKYFNWAEEDPFDVPY